jgi:glycosyltransferase involved in cell wall biosynthesis
MIAFFSIAPFLSGSERCLQLMLLEALEDGLRPVLVTSPNSPLESWAKRNRIDYFSVELNPIKVSSKARWLIDQFKLIFFLKRKNIRVIHSNQIWSYRAALLPAKILGGKVVCHFRDPIDSGSKWWLPRKPDLCIFISEHIQKQYFSVFELCESQNFLKMVDPIKRPERKSKSEQLLQKRESRELFKIDKERFVFGFIGQIAPVKGLLETIRILSDLKKNNWMLIVAGEDSSLEKNYFKACIREIKKRNVLDKVIFIGFQDDVSNVYKAIDLVIMLSKEEPLGLIPLEAGGFYRPSIVSRVGGLPETVNNGESGWIVDVDIYEQTVAIIDSINNEDVEVKSKKARQFIETINTPKEYWNALRIKYLESGIDIL